MTVCILRIWTNLVGILKWCEDAIRKRAQDDVSKWKYFLRYWLFVRKIHRWLVDSPYKGQWCGAFLFSVIWAWAKVWANNRDAGNLRLHRTHYAVTVMVLNLFYDTSSLNMTTLTARYAIFQLCVNIWTLREWPCIHFLKLTYSLCPNDAICALDILVVIGFSICLCILSISHISTTYVTAYIV